MKLKRKEDATSNIIRPVTKNGTQQIQTATKRLNLIHVLDDPYCRVILI